MYVQSYTENREGEVSAAWLLWLQLCPETMMSSSSITLHSSVSVDLAVSLFSYSCISFSGSPSIAPTQRRYGISLITKSIWSGLTNSEESGEGGWEREIMRDQCGRLTINWIGGGRMRSLKNVFFFFYKNGCTKHKGGFHQTHRCTYVCALTDTLVENFFWAVTLHVSCCYGDASLWSSQSAGLAGEEQGRGRQGDFIGGVQRGTGRGPDTKIIRSANNNSY